MSSSSLWHISRFSSKVLYPSLSIVILFLIIHVNGYLILISETTPPNTIVFNTSVNKLGSDREYKINSHKSAQYIKHLFTINSKDGQIRLKKSLKCDGIYYPNLFTFYIDSTSNRLRSIDYYSLPIRIFIIGENCNNDYHLTSPFYDHSNYNGDEYDNYHIINKRNVLTVEEEYGENGDNENFHFNNNNNENQTNYMNFEMGDVLFETKSENYNRQKILQRKRRNSMNLILDEKTHPKISEAKQWMSETYSSYAIHNTDKWNKICLKKSQFINSLTNFLPKTIQQYCKVNFLDVNDERFSIEMKNGDLVASNDVCIYELMWKVTITFSMKCNRLNIVDSDHRLKIVYHHQAFNDTDIAKRVRRELRNQSPFFEQTVYMGSVLEEQPMGTSVITVRARDPEKSQIVYTMESITDARSQSMFKIDGRSGLISTSSILDREFMDVHYFRVIATDDSFPPRSGTSTVQINVLDCNDHSPSFDAEQFDASIRESASVGSVVITLRATDKDIGKNAEIEYAIESVTGGGLTTPEEDNKTFAIDARTGAISTRSALDRERSEVYTVIVAASDMAVMQSERKTATTTVVIKILDDNDNYPQFSERTYTVSVPEDQWDGTNVIAHIIATDADQGKNAAIRFAIIGGNTQSQFAIDSMNGDVSLVKPLDYESVRSYRLVIRAQDGGNPSRSNTTQLLVNVLDANDNAPRFYASQFQETILESVPLGYTVVRVQAYDSDEGKNAEITYKILEREETLPLSVDPRTGWISTTKLLDREEQSRFSFQVLAVDNGVPPKTASASVVITVQDVNDNDPTFSPKYYEAVIGEDQPPGTSVTTVTATDPDEDSRLHYEISSGNTRGRFSITSQNGRGLVTIAQPLDYKQEKRFVLTITATDSGGRTDKATVNINITDANNFAPVFENAPYKASVFEDAPIGTTVLVVSAVDNDVGINAQITYSLNDESANGLGMTDAFSVNPQTGAIMTKALLDREKIEGYLLTVTAKDGGNPSLSDTTDVEIRITDVNDNPPRFKVPKYQSSISEDALIGTSVIQVSATDSDTGQNGIVKYMLSDKDLEDGSFVVDSTSGIIRTNKGLDRESIAVYHLTAIAVDKGTPPMSSSVEVEIRLEDINDSPPTFPSDKITLYVPENSPVGSLVGEIVAHDPDEGVNAIVHYSIIGGDDSNSFTLISRPGSEKAQILTMTELDYESPRKRFELIIRAASPPLRNDAHVEILVTDVNDNAPVLKDFQIIFNNFHDHFPYGEIGRIPAFDADVTDILTYRILSGNNANFVKLNTTTGGLTLSPQLNTNVPKFATMEVSVSDGINEAKAIMQLAVRLITENMLFNSVTVRLNEMTEEAFLSPLMNFFLDGLAAIIPCPRENIFLFSIQDDTDLNSRILNVSFSAKRPDVAHEVYYSSKYLQEKVYLNRIILARLATVEVLPFDDNLCVREPCLNYEQCLTVLKFGNASEFISSETVLFRSIYPLSTFACHCPVGFTGNHEHYLCDTEVDLCYSHPCQNEGKCLRKEGGYTCVCKTGFTGKTCEIEIKKLAPCTTDLCESGHSCIGNVNPYHVPYTPTCQLKSRSFVRGSFLTFESLKQRHRFTIELKFATVHQNGLLLYNGRYNEKHDFISLEILSGNLMFSYSLGDKIQKVQITPINVVYDGSWHTVTVKYFNRTATISVDDCDTAVALNGNFGVKHQCANQTSLILDRRCSLLTESCHRFLDLTGPLQIGGLPKIPANFPIETHHFIGCISELYIDHELYDLNSYVTENGTVSGCIQKAQSCLSEPCFNGGTCHEGWGTHKCECPEGFTGNACQESTALPWKFNGDGVISFNPLLRPIQLPWLIAFSFRTRQENAFFLQIQIGQNSSAIIALKSGNLFISYNMDDMFSNQMNLADGSWHRVEIRWSATEISISIDYGQRSAVIPTVHKVQGLYVGKVTVGAPDNTIGNIKQFMYYEGCIQDIRIGGPQSPLNRPAVKENVNDGCYSSLECPDQCPSHSSCTMEWEKSYCECLSGYIGPDCVPICSVNPCVNGICRGELSLSKGYRCECNSTTHSGEYCETEKQKPCPSGWWGENGCGPCKCNLKLGYHPDCNKITGECFCKENHYQPLNESSCLPCDCYNIGSYSSSCDILTGQCQCRDGVIGRRCDSCSNPYAEVTMQGCEVVYDSCPRSFSAGIWWPRTALGQKAFENCPIPASGKGVRKCDNSSGGWQHPDMFNCTSEPFIEIRKHLSEIEKSELILNTFVTVKLIADLEKACKLVDKSKYINEKVKYDVNNIWYKNTTLMWENEFEINYLNDEVNFSHDRLYGADILITEGIIYEVLGYELLQNGLNLSHSQDKYFIKNLVESAGTILDTKYKHEWLRITELTQRGPQDLVNIFNKYMITLASSQHDTFTNPFEVVDKNIIFGLDVVTSESLFGYEPQQLSEYHRNSKSLSSNQVTTESVILPDTSAFLHHSMKQKTTYISFPKYNNYIQDKMKFDKTTKILIPLEILGIKPPDKNEVTIQSMREYRAIISYAQYKDAGLLFPENFDETITRRWGIDIQVASPILSLTILIPSSQNDINSNFKSNQKFENLQASDEILDNNQKENNKNFDEIRISAHDLEEKNEQEFPNAPEIKIYNDHVKEADHIDLIPIMSENITIFASDENSKKIKRQIIEVDKSEDENRVIYRTLGSPNLQKPIKLQMWLNIDKNLFSPRSNPQCVRWNSFTHMWTRIGCQTELYDFTHYSLDNNDPIIINCTCNHISNFAVLVDVIDPEDIPEPSLLVQITSYSAFLLSLPILFCVLIALGLLRGLQTNSNTIHQNLVFCVFFAELLFFIGMQARKSLINNEFPCKLVAVGLHYSWLAAFAWAFIDCVHLYRMLTEMRDINHGPMGFYFSVGYGAPAVIVGLSVGVRAYEYGNSLFCWLSVYESVVWWLVGPIAVISVVNLFILFISVKAAFTLKEHVLGFGNLRTLLWLSVVSLPLMGMIWVLAVLTASENSTLLSMSLSLSVIFHAIFCLTGYCIINNRVRENLRRTFLRCIGQKVPLMEASLALSSSSQNITTNPRAVGFLSANYDSNRRNIGISASSTTSRSTTKTCSSPYRSDGQLRHTSTSTSNYNSASDIPSYMKSYTSGQPKVEKSRRNRKDSDSGSDTDGRSLDLASSHSSDDDESRTARSSETGHRSMGVTAVSYLPNIMENDPTTTPPEMEPVQSPQMFPNLKPTYGNRWSSQAPESYLPSSNLITRWSQDTGSDNEIQSQKASSPNPLPNPDITDTIYMQNKINIPPAILENVQENYNFSSDHLDNQYDLNDYERSGNREYHDNNFSEYETNSYSRQNLRSPFSINSERIKTPDRLDYDMTTQIVGHVNAYNDNKLLKDSIYNKQLPTYLPPSRTSSSPYISKEQLSNELYSPRSYYDDNNGSNVQVLLKQDYQQKMAEYHSDRMSEGSDKNGYHFPYTAEEDHTIPGLRTNDINNPGIIPVSQLGLQSNELVEHTQPGSVSSSIRQLAPLSSISDKNDNADDAETTV